MLAAAWVLAAAVAPAYAAKPEKSLSALREITIIAKQVPLDVNAPEQIRFGKLDWLGTLEIMSPSPWFGGFSGLAIDATGTRLLAISDAGLWLTAKLVYRGGRIAKLTSAAIGPLQGRDGRVLSGVRNADAEAIIFTEPGALAGKAYIAFEQRHRIAEVVVGRDGVIAVKRILSLPARAKSAKGNKGIEAIALLRAGPSKGALLAMIEEALSEDADTMGWLLGAARPAAVRLRQIGGFSLTDMTSLPNGDLLMLERRFRFSEGVKFRIRRIKAARVVPGALLDGEILFETDDTREIDNMEGIAAHRDGSGRTIVTIISDDNYNLRFQRTLLMQFALPGQ